MNYNTNKDIYQKGNKFLMNTYSRMEVVFQKAKMQYLWDVEGKKYTDFTGGYGCLNVGHSNTEVIRNLKKQISEIIQPSNIFYNIPQVELAYAKFQVSEKKYFLQIVVPKLLKEP